MNSSIECILAVHCRPRLTSLTALKATYLISFTFRYFQPNQHCGCFQWDHICRWKNATILNPFLARKGVNMDTYAFTTSSFIQLDLVLDRTSERIYSGNILQLNFFECSFGTDDQKFAARFCVLGVFLSSCHPWQLHSVGLEILWIFSFLD